MNRKIAFWLFVTIYLFFGFLIIGTINGFSNAKWFDGGMDLVYGIILIYLLTLLYFSYKLNKNKNILYVTIGFAIIVFERIGQILLQEISLKTNYQLVIVSWLWILVDIFMIIGFLFLVKGLWRIRNG